MCTRGTHLVGIFELRRVVHPEAACGRHQSTGLRLAGRAARHHLTQAEHVEDSRLNRGLFLTTPGKAPPLCSTQRPRCLLHGAVIASVRHVVFLGPRKLSLLCCVPAAMVEKAFNDSPQTCNITVIVYLSLKLKILGKTKNGTEVLRTVPPNLVSALVM